MSTYTIFVRCEDCHAVLPSIRGYDAISGSPDWLGEQAQARMEAHLPTCPVSVAIADRYGRGHVPGQVSDRGAPLPDHPAGEVA